MKVDKLTNFNKTMKILKENHSNWGSGTCPSTKVLIVPSNNLSNLQNSKTINKIMKSNKSANLNKIMKSNKSVNLNKIMESNKSVNLNKIMKSNKSVNLNKIMESNKSANLNNIMKSNKSANLNKIMKSNKSVNLNKIMKSNKSVNLNNIMKSNKSVNLNNIMKSNKLANLNKIMQFKITKLIKNIFATTFVVFLASCDGSSVNVNLGSETATASVNTAPDAAAWSIWGEWSPATATSTVQQISQTRTRTCNVAVNGVADNPPPNCSNIDGGNSSEARIIVNPLSLETDIAAWSVWSEWTPTIASSNVQQINQTRTRTCQVTVNGSITDDPAPNCSAIDGGSDSDSRTIANPNYDAGNTDQVDTATWTAWSEWAPATATSTVQQINQSRTRTCDVRVNGNADIPAPACRGISSETKTIANPDYNTSNTDTADTATWANWSQWLPANNTDTSVIDIIQTRTQNCVIVVNDIADSPPATCSGVAASETRTVENPLAADTASWTIWSPTTNTDTSVINIIQTRTCVVTEYGDIDVPAPTCSGSQTQTVENPLAADTASWTIWSPTTNTDTSVINIIQTRTCVVTEYGDN